MFALGTLTISSRTNPYDVLPCFIYACVLSFSVAVLWEKYRYQPGLSAPHHLAIATATLAAHAPVLPQIQLAPAALISNPRADEEDVWRDWPPRVSWLERPPVAKGVGRPRTRVGGRSSGGVDWNTGIRVSVYRMVQDTIDEESEGRPAWQVQEQAQANEVDRVVAEMRRQSMAIRMSAVLRDEFGEDVGWVGARHDNRESWWAGLRALVYS